MEIAARMRDVLLQEAAAIQGVAVTPDFVVAVEALVALRAKVATLGIGKAGLVAAKCASLLCATGTPAFFLHAAEAAHGDLGALEKEDLIIAFSTSGNTAELTTAVGAARSLGIASVIAVTASRQSPLGKASDLVLETGRLEEACPLGLVATTSIAVMSAIGDAIAIAAMEQRGFTREDFVMRHPGGSLGKSARGG